MAIGDHIRIITEEEFRIMSPPRRQKGEKPAATIRHLRRWLATAQHTIEALQLDRADKEKVIAGYDVQLSEADDAIAHMRRRNADQAIQLGGTIEKLRQQSERLAFLEGYYAKSQETTAPRISATGAPFPHHQAETFGRSGPGNPQGSETEREAAQGRGQDEDPARADRRSGEEISSRRQDHPAHQDRRPVEYVKMKSKSDHWLGF